MRDAGINLKILPPVSEMVLKFIFEEHRGGSSSDAELVCDPQAVIGQEILKFCQPKLFLHFLLNLPFTILF